MAQDTNLNTLIINKMTKAQYNSAEKSDNELYMVTDETYYTADEVDQKLANVSANLTGYAKETYVDQKVADLVGSSPDTLNTLNELASALGNDPNFATTITNQLTQKADKSYVDGEVTKLQTDIDNNASNITTLQESIASKANTADLAQVAKTGSFTDLNNIPSIPSVETTATENSTNAISSGYVYTLEDKLTNGTGGYKVMTAEYADNVPVISTNISTDAESDIKTTSPKAVKSYVDGNVVANPTLTGSETSLTSIGIGGTNFSVGSSSGGGYDFSNITPIVGTWDATNSHYSTSSVEFTVNKKYNGWQKGTLRPYDLSEYITNGAKALYVGCARFNSSSTSNTKYSEDVGTPDAYGSDNKHTTYGWKMIPLNIPFTTTELLASYKKNDGTISSFLQAEYNPSTHKINIYVYGFNSESGSGTNSWYAHYFILAIY